MAILMRTYLLLQMLVTREEGQDMAEYSLLIALIALALIAATALLGGNITRFYELTVHLLGGTVSIAA